MNTTDLWRRPENGWLSTGLITSEQCVLRCHRETAGVSCVQRRRRRHHRQHHRHRDATVSLHCNKERYKLESHGRMIDGRIWLLLHRSDALLWSEVFRAEIIWEVKVSYLLYHLSFCRC